VRTKLPFLPRAAIFGTKGGSKLALRGGQFLALSSITTCRATWALADHVTPRAATHRAAVLLIETDSISVIGPISSHRWN
jgi:hypothetical protein